jgi:single-strand DNA-binding protein
MNQMTIIGNIAEPKLTFTNSGHAKLEIGLATTRTVKEEKITTWHNVVAWGQLAENLSAVLQKGDRVIVIGRINEDTYTNKDGVEVKWRTVVADDAGKSCRWSAE